MLTEEERLRAEIAKKEEEIRQSDIKIRKMEIEQEAQEQLAAERKAEAEAAERPGLFQYPSMRQSNKPLPQPLPEKRSGFEYPSMMGSKYKPNDL